MELLLMGIVLLILGILLFVRPQWVFHLTEGWKSTGRTEPSDLYLLSTRFGGVMTFLVGAVSVIVYFME